MTKPREESGHGGDGYHTVHAERDMEANWEVNLANKLEEYLLKICSGEITGTQEDEIIPVNFAEAALLLQGSVQVYSRKVEYLHNLVLHALEFLSEKRHQDQPESTPLQPVGSSSKSICDEENDVFWRLDDVPVEPKNVLDSSTGKDSFLNHFVKPPANLVVLEGDCLDTTGDGGELESYLLATSDLCRDFILLDPCDALAVNDFLGENEAIIWTSGARKGNSTQKRFQSPRGRSGGTALKSPLRKNHDANNNQCHSVSCSFNDTIGNVGPNPPDFDNFGDSPHACNVDVESTEHLDSSDSESDDNQDPWKRLNPHEPGSLKVNPFRKVKAFRKKWLKSTKESFIPALFPLARMQGTISPEFNEIWEKHHSTYERQRMSQDPPLYEKLRQTLTDTVGGHQTCDAFDNNDDENDGYANDGAIPDFGQQDSDIPESVYMDEDVLPHHDKNSNAHIDANDTYKDGEPSSQASLEDLCRSHLDALLASIAESEKQTELATRVSSWKQKIEKQLEEQDSHPAFDIQYYGEMILDKLSNEADGGNTMSFTDVVKGQEKRQVAQSFSALLQLVNNRNADLVRNGASAESVCYSAVNPFHIRLLNHDMPKLERQFRVSKKRVKSPTRKVSSTKDVREKRMRVNSPNVKSSPQNGTNAISKV